MNERLNTVYFAQSWDEIPFDNIEKFVNKMNEDGYKVEYLSEGRESYHDENLSLHGTSYWVAFKTAAKITGDWLGENVWKYMPDNGKARVELYSPEDELMWLES